MSDDSSFVTPALVEQVRTSGGRSYLLNGSRFFCSCGMNERRHGGRVYIMADRYRGTIYVGTTSNLAARVYQHRNGSGSAGVTKRERWPSVRRRNRALANLAAMITPNVRNGWKAGIGLPCLSS